MFLMAFHRPVCGWLGVIHLDEAGKELQGVGAEISDPWRAGRVHLGGVQPRRQEARRRRSR